MQLDRGTREEIEKPIRKIEWCCSKESKLINGIRLTSDGGLLILQVGYQLYKYD